MSKGLGENFLTDEVKRRYKHQPDRPMILLDGVKLNLPRYYRDKIFIEKDGTKRIDLLQKRTKLSEKYIEKSYDKTLDQYRDWETDRKSTRLNSSHSAKSRMPSSA